MITKRSWLILACCLALAACRSTKKDSGSAGAPPAFGGGHDGVPATREKSPAERTKPRDDIADIRLEDVGTRDSAWPPLPHFSHGAGTVIAPTNIATVQIADDQLPAESPKQGKHDGQVMAPHARVPDVPIETPEAERKQNLPTVDDTALSAKLPPRLMTEKSSPSDASIAPDHKLSVPGKQPAQMLPLDVTATQHRPATNAAESLPIRLPAQPGGRVSSLVAAPLLPEVVASREKEKATPARLRIWDGLGAATPNPGKHATANALPISGALGSRMPASPQPMAEVVSLGVNSASKPAAATIAPALRVDPILANDAALWRAQQLERQAADQQAREEEWTNFRRLLQKWLKPDGD